VPLFWAGNALVGRALAGEVPPLALAFWRWAVALAILLPIGGPQLWAERAAARTRWRWLVFLGLLSVSTYNTLLYAALTTTTAVNATLVGSSMPVVIALLSGVWLRERLGALAIVGIAASLAGVLCVVARGDPAVLVGLRLRTGDALMLLATVSWSIFSVALRRRPVPLAPLSLLTAQVALGLAGLLPVYLVEVAAVGGFPLTARAAAGIAYVGVVPSVLAYYLWNRGIATLGPTIAGQYNNLLPVFTAALGVPLLGERLEPFHAAGFALIVVGIGLVSRETYRGRTSKRPR
jgi:drug/metabolite transporter (DMT)-like permease